MFISEMYETVSCDGFFGLCFFGEGRLLLFPILFIPNYRIKTFSMFKVVPLVTYNVPWTITLQLVIYEIKCLRRE